MGQNSCFLPSFVNIGMKMKTSANKFGFNLSQRLKKAQKNSPVQNIASSFSRNVNHFPLFVRREPIALAYQGGRLEEKKAPTERRKKVPLK